MLNYFNYFTEIEERFQQRRGALLLLSTLDWALIETWREAGIPLDAVLRGIDAAFDKYEARQKRGRMRRVNGLAWCAQAVMEAAEELREASAGTANPAAEGRDSGFESERVAAHLEAAAAALDAASVAPEACTATAARLRAPRQAVDAPHPSALLTRFIFIEGRIDAAQHGIERNAGLAPGLDQRPVERGEQQQCPAPLLEALFDLGEVVEVVQHGRSLSAAGCAAWRCGCARRGSAGHRG